MDSPPPLPRSVSMVAAGLRPTIVSPVPSPPAAVTRMDDSAKGGDVSRPSQRGGEQGAVAPGTPLPPGIRIQANATMSATAASDTAALFSLVPRRGGGQRRRPAPASDHVAATGDASTLAADDEATFGPARLPGSMTSYGNAIAASQRRSLFAMEAQHAVEITRLVSMLHAADARHAEEMASAMDASKADAALQRAQVVREYDALLIAYSRELDVARTALREADEVAAMHRDQSSSIVQLRLQVEEVQQAKEASDREWVDLLRDKTRQWEGDRASLREARRLLEGDGGVLGPQPPSIHGNAASLAVLVGSRSPIRVSLSQQTIAMAPSAARMESAGPIRPKSATPVPEAIGEGREVTTNLNPKNDGPSCITEAPPQAVVGVAHDSEKIRRLLRSVEADRALLITEIADLHTQIRELRSRNADLLSELLQGGAADDDSAATGTKGRVGWISSTDVTDAAVVQLKEDKREQENDAEEEPPGGIGISPFSASAADNNVSSQPMSIGTSPRERRSRFASEAATTSVRLAAAGRRAARGEQPLLTRGQHSDDVVVSPASINPWAHRRPSSSLSRHGSDEMAPSPLRSSISRPTPLQRLAQEYRLGK